MVPDYMADRGFSGFRSIWRIARPRGSYVIFSLFSLVLWGLALPDEKEEAVFHRRIQAVAHPCFSGSHLAFGP